MVKAQYMLGFHYNIGQGVTKDYLEAYKWYLLGAAQGDEPARRNMTRLETMMTSDQIAKGQKWAREFKPK